MPGPRIHGGNRRIVPIYSEYRYLSYTVTNAPAPGVSSGVTWLSCQIGKQRDPEKPKPFMQPDWIRIGSATVVRNPNYTEFTSPCGKFE